MHVLLVEDDDAIAEPLVEGLRREGFEVIWVSTGEAALAAAAPDIVLLDLGLPDRDGLAVRHEMRERSLVPIVAVTARRAEVNRVVGLDLGADDYIVKPFGFRELAVEPGATVARQEIFEQVWDPHCYGPTKTLGVHVASRRRKLGHPVWVETVRRVGFRLGLSDGAVEGADV